MYVLGKHLCISVIQISSGVASQQRLEVRILGRLFHNLYKNHALKTNIWYGVPVGEVNFHLNHGLPLWFDFTQVKTKVNSTYREPDTKSWAPYHWEEGCIAFVKGPLFIKILTGNIKRYIIHYFQYCQNLATTWSNHRGSNQTHWKDWSCMAGLGELRAPYVEI